MISCIDSRCCRVHANTFMNPLKCRQGFNAMFECERQGWQANPFQDNQDPSRMFPSFSIVPEKPAAMRMTLLQWQP